MVSRREHVIRGEVESEHIVQLFDSSESLGSGVAAFLAQGLAEDGKALVVARPRHVDAILNALGAAFTWIDIETNGTRACPPRPANVFISCSPKRLDGEPVIVEPDWWKVLIPDQEGFLTHALASGNPVFVQPTCPDGGPSGERYQANVQRCLELCFTRGCRLSLQQHKYLAIP